MPSNNKLSVRFIRKESSEKTDDMVVIQPLSKNQYSLTYTYGDTKAKDPHTLTLSDRDVFRWMRHTINLLEKDTDPFEGFQVDFPFMPSVYFTIDALTSAYHSILDALEFHLDNWPSVTNENDLDYDNYDYYINNETEEDDYTDMPPLVDVNQISSNNITERRGRHLFFD